MNVLTKESLLKKHKYAIAFFLFIFLYNYVFVNRCHLWQVEGYAYTFHLVDFSVGLHTGVLPGALFYGLFGKNVSQSTVSNYVLALTILFMLLLSFLLEDCAKHLLEQKKANVMLLVFFFVIGPYTAASCFHWFGYFDMYLFFLSILFFFCVRNRIAIYLTPVLFLLSVMIHFSSFLTCIPMFVIVLMYKCLKEKEERRKYKVVLLISVTVTIAAGFYFLLFESKNLNYSIEQFHSLLAERGGADYRDVFKEYYDYLFYKTFDGKTVYNFAEVTKGGWSTLFSFLRDYIRFNSNWMRSDAMVWSSSELAETIIAIPFFIGFYVIVIQYIRQNKLNKSEKGTFIPLFMTLLQIPVALIAILFSIDLSRWVTHIVTVLSAEMLFLVVENQNLLDTVDQKIEKNKPWVIAYLFIAATSNFEY